MLQNFLFRKIVKIKKRSPKNMFSDSFSKIAQFWLNLSASEFSKKYTIRRHNYERIWSQSVQLGITPNSLVNRDSSRKAMQLPKTVFCFVLFCNRGDTKYHGGLRSRELCQAPMLQGSPNSQAGVIVSPPAVLCVPIWQN